LLDLKNEDFDLVKRLFELGLRIGEWMRMGENCKVDGVWVNFDVVNGMNFNFFFKDFFCFGILDHACCEVWNGLMLEMWVGV
jgi:hypothetical protein